MGPHLLIPRQNIPSAADRLARFDTPIVTHVVDRPRLYGRLTHGLDVGTVLVAATAGWGKTLLAASWAGAAAGDLRTCLGDLGQRRRRRARLLAHVGDSVARRGRRGCGGGVASGERPGQRRPAVPVRGRGAAPAAQGRTGARQSARGTHTGGTSRSPPAGRATSADVVPGGDVAVRPAVAAPPPTAGRAAVRGACGRSRLPSRRGRPAVRGPRTRSVRRTGGTARRADGRVAGRTAARCPAPARLRRCRLSRRHLLRGRPRHRRLPPRRGTRPAGS